MGNTCDGQARVIGTYRTKDDAGKLNKLYASDGVTLDKSNLFVDVSNEDLDSDMYHYYTVESYAVEASIKELQRDHNL